MFSFQVQRLQRILYRDPDVMRCTCGSYDMTCMERGKITCYNGSITFLHVRFDPCMCQNAGTYQENRCDCIIFAFDQTKRKQGMFVIEVKDRYNRPSLTEIKEKIQYCINRMQEILGGHMNSIEVFPILCDEKHSALHAQASMTQHYKVSCYGRKKSIILSHYHQNIASCYLKAAEKWRN